LRSSEVGTPRRTVAVGIAADGPPAAANIATTILGGRRQRGVSPGEVLATLLLQLHLTAPRRHLQSMKVVRLLIVLQGLTHAVAPRRDKVVVRGGVCCWGPGSDGLDHHGRGSHGSRGRGSTLLWVALMLEVADTVGRGGVLGLRRHGQRLDGRGAVIHVFVCPDWRDEQGRTPPATDQCV
jgi:hypothetical protein